MAKQCITIRIALWPPIRNFMCVILYCNVTLTPLNMIKPGYIQTVSEIACLSSYSIGHINPGCWELGCGAAKSVMDSPLKDIGGSINISVISARCAHSVWWFK